MQEPVIIELSDFQVDLPRLHKLARIEAGTEDEARVKELVSQAERVARPKGTFTEAYVQAKGEDTVCVEGVTFTSKVLRVNLADAYRVFPFIATCGTELEEWSQGLEDILETFWADTIKQLALEAAVKAVREAIDKRLAGKAATMNPGSLPDWPLPEQKPLFSLLGKGPESIGVTLTPSFLMIPSKSVSGLRFPTETGFENCQLCPRENCPGRRAPYDQDLFAQRYGIKP